MNICKFCDFAHSQAAPLSSPLYQQKHTIMATHKIHSSVTQPISTTAKLTLIQKYNAFADSQKDAGMFWWVTSLMVIGTLFVPLTFLLVYSLSGPTLPFLFFSMISFFACVVANMGGMGIRASISTFFFSVVLHLAMILMVLIF